MYITDKDLPGLYQSSDRASMKAQKLYFCGLLSYLLLLIGAAAISFSLNKVLFGALLSAFLFLVTLTILIALRVKRPYDLWYNGRAVAESVKTRSWRWMMRAEPYSDSYQIEIVSNQFINDLKAILNQNRSVVGELSIEASAKEPISDKMKLIRLLPICDRLDTYRTQRIEDQANWYSQKALFNKKSSTRWFIASVILHSGAILMLLYRIGNPDLSLPIEVVATAASAVLTWMQAKKHNELYSSYSLSAHEIVLIKGEAISINSEQDLSDFVVNSENAFSREHTQWVARKNE